MIDPLSALKTRATPFWLRYYNIEQAWPQIQVATETPAAQDVLYQDLELFVRTRGDEQPYQHGSLPIAYSKSDWADDDNRKPYWDLVIPGASLWLANFYLELAKAVDPEKPWRLIEGAAIRGGLGQQRHAVRSPRAGSKALRSGRFGRRRRTTSMLLARSASVGLASI